MSVDGKAVLITGGGGGIGRATALAFANAGARVAIADMNAEAGQETTRMVRDAGTQAIFVEADVTHSGQVASLVDFVATTFGQLNLAVNNAGIGYANLSELGPTHEADEAIFDGIMAVNAKGVWLCMKYEIPVLLACGGGAIVNMSSVSGLIGAAGISAYAASKHAVIGLTRTAAIEYAKAGIRVNAVCPAWIDTAMIGDLKSRPEGERQLVRGIPMKRIGTPDEVAAAVVWLCSDESSFVTGQALAVDGGMVAQ